MKTIAPIEQEPDSARPEIVGPHQRAVEDILEIARMRAAVHFGANLFHYRFAAEDEAERVDEITYIEQLAATREVSELFGVFMQNAGASSLDLAFIENHGHWNRAAIDQIETEIRRLALEPYWGQATSGYLESSSPDSRRRVWLHPGFVKEKGKIALRRKRNLFSTRPRRTQLFDTQTGQVVERWRQFTIDKVSEFALDGDMLFELFSATDPEIHQEMKAISDRGIVGEVKHPRSLALLEEAIVAQWSEFISPACTIYYVHQDYITNEEMAGRGVVAKHAIAASISK